MTNLEKSVIKESKKVFDERQAKMIQEVLQMCPKPKYKLATPQDLWKLAGKRRLERQRKLGSYDPKMFKFE